MKIPSPVVGTTVQPICSGLVIGPRQLDGAHIEFLRGVRNPLGMKVGPNYDIDTILKIIERLNPENEAGRITLITRFWL